MSVAPKIALLVHNVYERDPRVHRHARAALGAGYRVAVLSAGAPEGRWGVDVGGVRLYESRVVRRSVLGRVRAGYARWTARAGVGEGSSSGGTALTGGHGGPVAGRTIGRGASRLGGAIGDLWTIVLLLRNNVGLYRQFRGVGARLVHANDLNVLPAGYLLARAWGAPLLYDSHELWTQLDADWSPLLRRLFGLIEGPLTRRCAAVVTVNRPIAAELAAAYAIPMPVVVMNCPEAPVGDYPPDAELGRGGSGLAGGAEAARTPLRVIYQGMLDNAGRGLEGVIGAGARVDGVVVTLRGPGGHIDALRQHIINKTATNVSIKPPIKMVELVAALTPYDVGVVSYLPVSKNHLFSSPNKLFEYMSAGLAVICSDLPVLREVVTEADCGLLYEAGNVEALAEAMRRLAADRGLLARFKANAKRAAVGRYNAEHEEGKLLDVYRCLVANREGSGHLQGGSR